MLWFEIDTLGLPQVTSHYKHATTKCYDRKMFIKLAPGDFIFMATAFFSSTLGNKFFLIEIYDFQF